MIDFLIRILPYIAPALRYADNPYRPLWRVDLLIYMLIVYALDLIVAHAYFKPLQDEWTVSHVLERTCLSGWPQDRAFALAINAISPGHIKGVA